MTIPQTVPRNSRVYGVIEMADGGMAQLRLSATPPVYNNPMAVLIWRGVLPQGNDVVLELVSDPSENEALRGPPGADATDAQAAAAVSTYLSAHPPAPGKDGISVTADQLAASVASYLAAHPPAAGRDAVAPTVAIGKVTSLASAATPTVKNSGSATALSLDFGIPAAATGPAAATLLGTATLIDRATIALSAGVRSVSVTGVPGLAAGDGIVLIPSASLPAGYAITSAVATAAGTLVVTLVAPLLAAGTSTSIAVKIYRLNA